MKILHRMGGAILTIHKEWRYSFGKISYKEEDVEAWDQSWEPSEKVVRHLLQVWMCRPLANVRFVATANGGVSYTVTCLNGSVNELSDVHVQQRELVKRCPCRTRDCLFRMFYCTGKY